MAPAQTYTARRCARDIMELLEHRVDDWAGFATEAARAIQKLMARPDLLTLGIERQANHMQNSLFLYYDYDFQITLSQVPSSIPVPVHDHGTWELVGLYRGSLEHTLYLRSDDGSRPGYADLEVLESRLMRPPEVVAAIPSITEIHGLTALAQDTYIVVVAGERYKPVRRYYDPQDHSYVERGQHVWRTEALR